LETTINSYKDLFVWQKRIVLVKSVYQFTELLPEKEKYGLVSQMRRCAVSVPANIAEGWGRGRNQYFPNHLRMARGSLFELETQYLICVELGFGIQNEIPDLCAELGKMLSAMIQKTENIKK